MKEKIDQLAKGIFKWDQADIQLSPSQIKMEVNSGECREGSFKIKNTKGRVMKGLISTDCHYIDLEKSSFQGEENEIKFRFNGQKYTPGEVIKGNIRIISDCGSARLPFSVTINVPSCTVSTGKIKDLFHFANLARENGEEAEQLFKNSHFEEVFLYKDSVNIALYRGLIASSSKAVSMEEFLISIHKKLPIQLSVNQTSFSYDSCTEKITDKLTIKKDNWGFGEFHIESDVPFIIPQHKIIWTDNFIDDTYSLVFTIDPDMMTPGNNYGKLIIRTVRQNIEVEINAVKPGTEHSDVEEKISRQRKIYQLIDLHMDFSMNRIDKSDYVTGVEAIADSFNSVSIPAFLELLKIHIAIIDNREQQVNEGLERLSEISAKLEQQDEFLYCGYQYLRGIWDNDANVKKVCIYNIEECYKNKKHDWRILWFLLYLSSEYASESIRYNAIFEHLKNGCHSPVMYFEICSILNDNPGRLTELTPELVSCLHWGCNNDYLNKELIMRYSYLAGRVKIYSPVILKDICTLYNRYEEDELLAVICSIYMKGQITSTEAFKWYVLGIKKNLKLTDLYEYYMYSIDESQEIYLNQSVLIYFLYDNHLTIPKKAMLYAYIIRNKESIPDAYEAYKKTMKEFCFEQLNHSRISPNLAVIYEEFINDESLDDTVAAKLPAIMFSHEITCYNPDIAGVYVTHRELKKDEFVPLKNGKAIVQIFTQQSHVFLADRQDNRYTMSIDYTSNKMLHLDHLAEKCFDKNKNDIGLLLYLYDKADHFHQRGDMVIEVRKNIFEAEEISEYQKSKVFSTMLRYYYDNFEGELLDAALSTIDWSLVSVSDREQFIEYCAVRHYYDKAMEGIMLYGYEKLSGKRLLQIASMTFEKNINKEDVKLVRLAWHIFNKGKFDENVINYLCKYFIGGIYEENQIWNAAHGFGIECKEFEERVIEQMVFTGEVAPEAYNIFYSYYDGGSNKRLIKAFLKMTAHKYMVNNWIIPNKMFEFFYSEVRAQENITCLIAVLKYLSQQPELSKEETEFVDYNVNNLYEKGLVFPFFKDFYGKISLPVHIMDEHYVEYIADPECEVEISYFISSTKDDIGADYKECRFVTETMKEVYEGIRVKEFVLFQDELLQYYISEIHKDGEKITMSRSVHFDESMDNMRVSSKYHNLNTMMIAREMGDDTTLVDMMKEYAKEQQAVKNLFKPLF